MRLPPMSRAPDSSACRPLPGRAVKFSVSGAESPSASAYATTARASGCSDLLSSASAEVSSSFSVIPSAGRTSVTFGRPSVTVPVLSSAMIFALPVSSRETAVLNRMPFFAPRPLPTIMATGVARPRAQGQEMTRTEIPRANA